MKDLLHCVGDGCVYIVYELADCGSLASLIEKNVTFTYEEISSIFYQIVQGLIYLHSVHMVHQDVKPSNVLVFSDGSIKVSDLGIGHSFESAATIVGTPAYQAPEVFLDEDEDDIDYDTVRYDPTKGDVWSLGITLYEVCFKCLPFAGSDIYEIARNAFGHVLNVPDSAPADLKDLLSKLLSIDPESRISLEEASLHPFLASGKKKYNFKEHSMAPPPPNLALPIKELRAIVCGEDYQFNSRLVPGSLPVGYRAITPNPPARSFSHE